MANRHEIKLNGKTFTTYEGLLDAAHRKGLKMIRVKLEQVGSEANGQTWIASAEVVMAGDDGDDQVFTEIGDANPRNVARHVVPHLPRMAATRAKARALRDATNNATTAVEELEDVDVPAELGELTADGFKPSEATRTAAEALPPAAARMPVSPEQLARIAEVAGKARWSDAQRAVVCRKRYKCDEKELTADQASDFLAHLVRELAKVPHVLEGGRSA